MADKSKEFNIQLLDDETCKDYNKSHDTNLKSMERQVEDMLDDILDMIDEVYQKGGGYRDDSIKIKVEVEYMPEDK